MTNRTWIARFASVLVAVPLVWGGSLPADSKEGPAAWPAIYSEKPEHLWNRLHAALLVRTGPDGKTYGGDRLEPLLWTESNYLLSGNSAERVIAVLEEFERTRGWTLIDDHVKRATLQRDLWLVSNWLSKQPDSAARRRLDGLLAQAIARVALTAAEIDQLPDTYAQAVASRKYATGFDMSKVDPAYLPVDLFDETGRWVCVAGAKERVARFHLAEDGTNAFTNSVFLVFLNLPGGRAQTLDYLKQLAALDHLLVPNADEPTRRSAPFLPHSNFPVWPIGTQVALARRALLIDADRQVRASKLMEGLQIRVVTAEAAPLTKQTLDRISTRRPPAEWEAFFEFQLRRKDLFAKTAGGLRDVSAERDFKTGFNSHPIDEFNQTSRSGSFPERSQPFESNRASCGMCHNYPGSLSFNSLPGFEFGGPFRVDDLEKERLPRATSVSEVERRAVKWKKRGPTL